MIRHDVRQERWRPVPGRAYEVSDKGRVRRADNGYVLKARKNKSHTMVWISDGLDPRAISVHRLVAAAFIGPCPEGLEVNHINGDGADNRVENLEYITHAENCRHAYRLGLTPPPPLGIGEDNGRAILGVREVKMIRSERSRGVIARVLALRFGVARSTIDAIGRRVIWRHI